MWTVDYGLWTVDCGLWTVDCGLWNVDCGLWPVEPVAIQLMVSCVFAEAPTAGCVPEPPCPGPGWPGRRRPPTCSPPPPSPPSPAPTPCSGPSGRRSPRARRPASPCPDPQVRPHHSGLHQPARHRPHYTGSYVNMFATRSFVIIASMVSLSLLLTFFNVLPRRGYVLPRLGHVLPVEGTPPASIPEPEAST